MIKHMGVHKLFLLDLISERDDWRDFLSGLEEGTTRADAIAAIHGDPREVFCSCDCPKEPNGSCAGSKRQFIRIVK